MTFIKKVRNYVSDSHRSSHKNCHNSIKLTHQQTPPPKKKKNHSTTNGTKSSPLLSSTQLLPSRINSPSLSFYSPTQPLRPQNDNPGSSPFSLLLLSPTLYATVENTIESTEPPDATAAAEGKNEFIKSSLCLSLLSLPHTFVYRNKLQQQPATVKKKGRGSLPASSTSRAPARLYARVGSCVNLSMQIAFFLRRMSLQPRRDGGSSLFSSPLRFFPEV